jgi:hypothetical protein
MNLPTDERTSLDEHGRGGQSDCAKAMAEAEKVLRELALFTRRSKPEHSNAATKARKAPVLIAASVPIDRVVLDPDLDFVLHKDGTIEFTGLGFERFGYPVRGKALPGTARHDETTPRCLYRG